LTRLIKWVRPFNPNTTHLNKRMTQLDLCFAIRVGGSEYAPINNRVGTDRPDCDYFFLKKNNNNSKNAISGLADHKQVDEL